MIKLDDFIKNKHGKKKYRYFCDLCHKDRGYLFRNARGGRKTGHLCVKCTNSGSDIETSNGYCKHCNINHELPLIGQSNDYWYWECNSCSINGGYFRCRKQLSDKDKNWIKENPEKAKIKFTKSAEKYRSSYQGRIRSSISSRMSSLLKKRTNKSSHYEGSKFSNLTWTINDLITHLESKFYPNPETGELMTWENYGIGGWEIDHVVPDSWFNYKTIDDGDFVKSWSLENLQPLWAKKNRSKSNRFAGGY